jgi:hypothetical protein
MIYADIMPLLFVMPRKKGLGASALKLTVSGQGKLHESSGSSDTETEKGSGKYNTHDDGWTFQGDNLVLYTNDSSGTRSFQASDTATSTNGASSNADSLTVDDIGKSKYHADVSGGDDSHTLTGSVDKNESYNLHQVYANDKLVSFANTRKGGGGSTTTDASAANALSPFKNVETLTNTYTTTQTGTPAQFHFVRDNTNTKKASYFTSPYQTASSQTDLDETYKTHAEGDESNGVDQFSSYTKGGTYKTTQKSWGPTQNTATRTMTGTRSETLSGSGTVASFSDDQTFTLVFDIPADPSDPNSQPTTLKPDYGNYSQHTDGTMDINSGWVLTATVTGGPPNIQPTYGWFDQLVDTVATGVANSLNTVTFGYSNQVLTSETFGNVLDGTDQFFAGTASGLTAGLSDKAREKMYGQAATKNHQGALYTVGQVSGTALGVAVSFGNPCGMATAGKVGFKALNVVQAAGGSINAVQDWNDGNYLGAALNVAGVAGNVGALRKACFAAGTPLLTPTGDKRIEQFQPGDLILSRSELDPNGELEAKVVEEVFVRLGQILHLHVGGQVIRTTAEHPFWVQGKGWLPASELQVGDLLNSHDGQWVAVEDLLDTSEYETVYNLRITDYHTYFVGSRDWGFSVWAHNACVYQVKDANKIVRYVGIANTKVGNTLSGRLRAGIQRVRQFFGITDIEGKVIPGLEKITTAEAEAVEEALIGYYGLLGNKMAKGGGTLLNRSLGTNSTGLDPISRLHLGKDVLRRIGYPGF